jgi:hypothetical protein
MPDFLFWQEVHMIFLKDIIHLSIRKYYGNKGFKKGVVMDDPFLS